MNRENPISIEVLGELNWKGFDETFQKLVQRIDQDDQARQEWIIKIQAIEQQLRGKEPRNNKPWAHATEISIPLTKKLLRRWLPVIYNLVAYADPICHFKASDAGAASVSPRIEDWFTWLLRDYMDGTLTDVQFLCHDIGSKGMGYLGVCWDYRTELESRVVMVDNLFPQGVPQDLGQIVQVLQAQYEIEQPSKELLAAAQKIAQGAKFVRISYRKVIADKPRIVRHDPLFVIVPPESAAAEDAEYVALAHEFTASELRQRAFDGFFDKDAVEKLIAAAGKTKEGAEQRTRDVSAGANAKRDKQGLAGVSADRDGKPFRVYQVYCTLDYNGDGIDERCILWYSPLGNIRLALVPFVFSFPYWPVFRFDYEKVDPRPYISQGMGEQLQDLQSHYNKQFRATDDAIDIQLAPVFQMRTTSKVMPRAIKWGPGKFIPVNEIGDVSPLEKSPFNLHEYLQNRGETKMFAEEMVGSIDAALAATGRQLERRTAFEVQAVTGQIEAVQGMDAAIFQQTMGKVFQCVWQLWLDLGPDAIYYNVTREPFPQLFRKSEHNYKYQLTPAGTPGNTNRQAELGHTVQIMQVLAKTPAVQMINWQYLAERVASLLDPRLAKMIILPPPQQQTQGILQQAAAQLAQGNYDDILGMASAGGGPAAQ